MITFLFMLCHECVNVYSMYIKQDVKGEHSNHLNNQRRMISSGLTDRLFVEIPLGSTESNEMQ